MAPFPGRVVTGPCGRTGQGLWVRIPPPAPISGCGETGKRNGPFIHHRLRSEKSNLQFLTAGVLPSCVRPLRVPVASKIRRGRSHRDREALRFDSSLSPLPAAARSDMPRTLCRGAGARAACETAERARTPPQARPSVARLSSCTGLAQRSGSTVDRRLSGSTQRTSVPGCCRRPARRVTVCSASIPMSCGRPGWTARSRCMPSAAC